MSEKSDLYNALKEAGATFPKPYVNMTVEDLQGIARQMMSAGQPEQPGDDDTEAALEAMAAVMTGEPEPPVAAGAPLSAPTAAPVPQPTPAPERPRVAQPRASQPQSRPATPDYPAVATRTYEEAIKAMQADIKRASLNGELVEGRGIPWQAPGQPAIRIEISDKGAERAGLTYSTPVGQPIRVDTKGRIWFRDEVLKPAVPKARMTRTTRYVDPGVKQERTYREDGRLDEIFEVAGDSHNELTIKTTLQSFQVGEYRDPRFPFNVHTYDGIVGFSFSEVNAYFGGLTMVPGTIKTVYVNRQLSYSIPTVVNTIKSEFDALRRQR
jgi:hypothetical protein